MTHQLATLSIREVLLLRRCLTVKSRCFLELVMAPIARIVAAGMVCAAILASVAATPGRARRMPHGHNMIAQYEHARSIMLG